MPIEIRELHIKINVSTGAGPAGGDGRGRVADGSEAGAQRTAEDELVTRCVEQVMDLLRNRAER